jgi:hypothetical protein
MLTLILCSWVLTFFHVNLINVAWPWKWQDCLSLVDNYKKALITKSISKDHPLLNHAVICRHYLKFQKEYCIIWLEIYYNCKKCYWDSATRPFTMVLSVIDISIPIFKGFKISWNNPIFPPLFSLLSILFCSFQYNHLFNLKL